MKPRALPLGWCLLLVAVLCLPLRAAEPPTDAGEEAQQPAPPADVPPPADAPPATTPPAASAPARDAETEEDEVDPSQERVSADNNLSFPVDI